MLIIFLTLVDFLLFYVLDALQLVRIVIYNPKGDKFLNQSPIVENDAKEKSIKVTSIHLEFHVHVALFCSQFKVSKTTRLLA